MAVSLGGVAFGSFNRGKGEGVPSLTVYIPEEGCALSVRLIIPQLEKLMVAPERLYTPSEAAAVSGLALKEVNNVIVKR